MHLSDNRWTVITKVSSVAYAQAVIQAWQDRSVLIPFDASALAVLPQLAEADVVPIPPGGGWFDAKIELNEMAEPAQVSFSSGTTGQPKPILISRRAISDTCRRLIDFMQIDHSIREYIGVPLTYSFGLARLRTVAAAGGRSYLPENGFRLDEFNRMLMAGEVNALSAVPTLLRLVLQQRALLAEAGPQLRWLEIGSQFMTAQEKAAIGEIFPNARIVQHYGLTEASRTTLLRIDGATDEQLVSVGSAIGDVRIRIDEEGRICIAGPHLADGVLTDGGLVPTASEEGWLRTSDLGEIRNGHLYFLGRADDLINVSGIKIPAGFFEQELFDSLGQDAPALAVAARKDSLRGEGVLVAYESSVDEAALGDAVEAVSQRWNLTAGDVACWPVTELPRTETGKVRRKALTDLYERDAPVADDDADAPAGDGQGALEALRRLFSRAFPRRAIEDGDSFLSLDGDSLNYITVSLGIEQITGALPERWETLPIEALARLGGVSRTRRWVRVEAGVLARCLAPIMIVTNHAGGTAVRGGAALLLIVAGQNFARFFRSDLADARLGKVVRAITVNILIPYWLIVSAFGLAKHSLSWSELLLVDNWLALDPGRPFETWFVQVLAQATLICLAIAATPPGRRLWRDRPFAISYALLVSGAVLAIAHYLFWRPVLTNGGRELTWQFWLFAAGLTTIFATNTARRLAVFALVLAVAIPLYGADPSRLIASVGGLALLLWVRNIPMPRASLPLVTLIGSSSLFIYMMHGRAPVGTVTANWPIDLIRIGTGIVIGIATWFAYEQGRKWIGKAWRRFRPES